MVIGGVIGIGFGWLLGVLAANTIADLAPIEALRYE